MVTDLLKEKEVEFKEINVQSDPAIMQELVEKTGQMGVPQTNINGQWVLGFDPNKIESLLK